MPASRPFLGRAFVLFRVTGIEVAIHPSWLVMVAVLAFAFRSEVLPGGLPGPLGAAAAIGFTLIFYGFVLGHELAHSLVARRQGLDPRRIVLFLLGGVSQIARESSGPREEYQVAVAGPLASLLFAGILAALSRLLHPARSPGLPGIWGTLAMVNLTLAGFNLLPGFPLDGGRVLRSVLWAVTGDRSKATRWAAVGGKALAVVLIAGGAALLVGFGDLGHGGPGILYVALGLFLYSIAGAAGRAGPEEPSSADTGLGPTARSGDE